MCSPSSGAKRARGMAAGRWARCVAAPKVGGGRTVQTVSTPKGTQGNTVRALWPHGALECGGASEEQVLQVYTLNHDDALDTGVNWCMAIQYIGRPNHANVAHLSRMTLDSLTLGSWQTAASAVEYCVQKTHSETTQQQRSLSLPPSRGSCSHTHTQKAKEEKEFGGHTVCVGGASHRTPGAPGPVRSCSTMRLV
jgi:hypothetical protein